MGFWKWLRDSQQPRKKPKKRPPLPPLPRFQARRPTHTTEEVTGDTITDKQIRELLNADLLSEWEAHGAFKYAPERAEASDPHRSRAYAADVYNRYMMPKL